MSDAINPEHYKRLPSEAIDIIEAAIENAPSNKDAYLQGQVLKYVLWCWNKNGIEDLKKAKRYLDRLVKSFDEIDLLKPADQPKPTVEVAVEVTGEVKNPIGCPDGWRFLEVGEVIRKWDKPKNGDAVPLFWIGTPCCNNQFILRRNKFEVGEKVVHGDCKSLSISVVGNILGDGWVDLVRDGVSTAYHVKDLAPYIEDAIPEIAVEVTGKGAVEVKNPLGCPDGWRFLEVGEVIRKGDVWLEDGQIHSLGLLMIGQACQTHWKPIIRRNRFEVGEKVVHVPSKDILQVIAVAAYVSVVDVRGSVSHYPPELLAPYIEEAT